mmetsp:Transcript_2854/g.11553  ORF Transcript_2854/g.11553 Transcript_2854/m.11553 type:complete len:382 (-) Transcript_2854:671-1816(-)
MPAVPAEGGPLFAGNGRAGLPRDHRPRVVGSVLHPCSRRVQCPCFAVVVVVVVTADVVTADVALALPSSAGRVRFRFPGAFRMGRRRRRRRPRAPALRATVHGEEPWPHTEAVLPSGLRLGGPHRSRSSAPRLLVEGRIRIRKERRHGGRCARGDDRAVNPREPRCGSGVRGGRRCAERAGGRLGRLLERRVEGGDACPRAADGETGQNDSLEPVHVLALVAQPSEQVLRSVRHGAVEAEALPRGVHGGEGCGLHLVLVGGRGALPRADAGALLAALHRGSHAPHVRDLRLGHAQRGREGRPQVPLAGVVSLLGGALLGLVAVLGQRAARPVAVQGAPLGGHAAAPPAGQLPGAGVLNEVERVVVSAGLAHQAVVGRDSSC